jgi:hypothetical protein
MALLPNQAHAQDEEHYLGIRSLKSGGEKGAPGGSSDKKGSKKSSKKGSKKSSKKMGSKRMSCDEMPADMIDFMSDMMMKSDATVDMMNTMEDVSDGTFMVNGNMYSMEDMEPMLDMLTADATIDVDGVELDPELYPPPTVFVSNSNGMSMLVTTTLEGDVDTVFQIDAEGTTTAQMQAISPGCMVSITPEMMDEEKLSEFTLGEAVLVPGTDDPTRKLETSALDPATGRQLQAPCGPLRVIEVAFGADSSFCSKAGGRRNAIARIGEMVALANEKYKVPGICARISIKFCDIQCNASTDRYNSQSALASREQSCEAFALLVIDKWKTTQYLKPKRGDATQPCVFRNSCCPRRCNRHSNGRLCCTENFVSDLCFWSE